MRWATRSITGNLVCQERMRASPAAKWVPSRWSIITLGSTTKNS